MTCPYCNNPNCDCPNCQRENYKNQNKLVQRSHTHDDDDGMGAGWVIFIILLVILFIGFAAWLIWLSITSSGQEYVNKKGEKVIDFLESRKPGNVNNRKSFLAPTPSTPAPSPSPYAPTSSPYAPTSPPYAPIPQYTAHQQLNVSNRILATTQPREICSTYCNPNNSGFISHMHCHTLGC